MSDDEPGHASVPYEEGLELTKRSRARGTIFEALKSSPVRVFGKDLIRSTALELERWNKTGRPVTACRVALRLRKLAAFAPGSLLATTKTDADLQRNLEIGQNDAEVPALKTDTDLKKKARRKHDQAVNAFKKTLSLIASEEISTFVTLELDAARPLEQEIERLRNLIETPVGLRRGHQVVAISASVLQDIFYHLTESRLRGRRGQEKQDEEVTELLFGLLRKVVPENINDEAVYSAIETSLKSAKHKTPNS